MGKYRQLEEGEIVRRGDEWDACNDGWRDPADWQPAARVRGGLGRRAPDPAYPSHTNFRRAHNPLRRMVIAVRSLWIDATALRGQQR